MNARRAGGLLAVGAVLVGLLTLPRPARGGAPAATYVGSTVCTGCHGGRTTSWKATPHAKALWKVGAPGAGAIVADFSGKPPFTQDQVGYVLGVGERAQAYLDANYQVLPGMWSVKEKKWVAQAAGDGKTQCLGCHTTGFSGAANTWKEMSVGCETCHGPGSAHLTSANKAGTMVNPSELQPKLRAMVCGQCHARGKPKDAAHAFPIGFRPGDDLDQFMSYDEKPAPNAMNSQYNEMRFGGGKHLAHDVTCITCHDPHNEKTPTMLRQTQPDLCLQCHKNLPNPPHNPDVLKTTNCTACHRHMRVHAQ